MFIFSCAKIMLRQRALVGNTAWVLSHQFIQRITERLKEIFLFFSYPSRKKKKKGKKKESSLINIMHKMLYTNWDPLLNVHLTNVQYPMCNISSAVPILLLSGPPAYKEHK